MDIYTTIRVRLLQKGSNKYPSPSFKGIPSSGFHIWRFSILLWWTAFPFAQAAHRVQYNTSSTYLQYYV